MALALAHGFGLEKKHLPTELHLRSPGRPVLSPLSYVLWGVSLGGLPILSHPGRNSAGLLVPQTTAKLTQATGLWEERHSYFEQTHQQVPFLD